MPAGGDESAACSVHYGPVRAPLSGGVLCCGQVRPPRCGDGGGGGGDCGLGGAAARNAVAAGVAPPLYPPPPRPPHRHLLFGGGAEHVARCKPSPCSLCSRESLSPASLAERDPALDRCCCGGGDGGGGGCDAQSGWKTIGGGRAGLSWTTLSSEASPLRLTPHPPLRQRQPGPGSDGGGDGGGGDDGGAGGPLWSPSSPLMLFLLSALYCCPEISKTSQLVVWKVETGQEMHCKQSQTHADQYFWGFFFRSCCMYDQTETQTNTQLEYSSTVK